MFANIIPRFKAGMMAGLGIPLATYAATELSSGFKEIWQPWNYSLSNIGFTILIYAIYLTNVGVVYGLILLLGYPSQSVTQETPRQSRASRSFFVGIYQSSN